jgi:hypothetical protein
MSAETTIGNGGKKQRELAVSRKARKQQDPAKESISLVNTVK